MLKLKALFVFLVLFMASTASAGGCQYQGKQYELFDVIGFLSPVYNELNDQDYSPDGYTVIASCMPLAEMNSMHSGDFSVVELPVLGADWIVVNAPKKSIFDKE